MDSVAVKSQIKIVHLEDSQNDSELIHSIIQNGDIPHDYYLTENENDFINILETQEIDIILSDYNLPNYSGEEALSFVRLKYPTLPFIYVSGAIGEDTAIQALHNGATDYVLKNKLERLVPAIKRAIREHDQENHRKFTEIKLWEKSELIRQQNENYLLINKKLEVQNIEKEKRAIELTESNNELLRAEEQFRMVVESTPNAIVLVNEAGIITLINQKTELLFGYERMELVGQNLEILLPGRFKSIHIKHRNEFSKNPTPRYVNSSNNLFAMRKDGTEVMVEIGLNPLKTARGPMLLATIVDVTERKIQEIRLKKHNRELITQNKEKELRAAELIIANVELSFQNSEKEKRAAELIIANVELSFQNSEKENRAAELALANIELIYQNTEKENRAAELFIANNELLYQNIEKEKRAAELVLANIELSFQNSEKENRAAELVVANTELTYQNTEKENRAAELIIANTELIFQNTEKEKRAAELILANHELAFQNTEREKRATELIRANIQKNEEAKIRLILEAKNKNITDSIYYAKRIQMAKLPKKELIYASLTDCFILFKPKDIVSGDFYFFHNTPSHVYIVAADCTGHGVPGAFMSMIGTDKLTEAFLSTGDPSKILKFLNRGVKSALHQSESRESTRDGMDIAICAINNETHLVQYSGANRPIWIIEHQSTEVKEIKATKKAIGGFTHDDQDFITHSIQLNKGDTFYIFTDGYADQFGGKEGKKLMTKKFKDILLSIQHKSMKEQEVHLSNFIELWRSDNEQVDDILVIGVRI